MEFKTKGRGVAGGSGGRVVFGGFWLVGHQTKGFLRIFKVFFFFLCFFFAFFCVFIGYSLVIFVVFFGLFFVER